MRHVIARISRALCLTPLCASTACVIDASNVSGANHHGSGTNIPVAGVSADGLGYSVRARSFTSDALYGPMLQSRFIGAGTAVIGYGRGSATVEIRDATNLLIHQQTITSDIVQGSAVTKGTPPFTVQLRFRQFTGVLSLGIGPADSTRAR